MFITANDLAECIIQKCNKDSKPINNIRLNDILYFLQRYFLQNENGVCFPNDIALCGFGIRVNEVYYRYSSFVANDIDLFTKEEIQIKNHKPVIDGIIEIARELEPWEVCKDTQRKDGLLETSYKGNDERVLFWKEIKSDACLIDGINALG